jgi:hypothetical protein
MANFVESAQDLLAFGESGRDNVSYEFHLEKAKDRGLRHKDYDQLAAIGADGIILLNIFLKEIRRVQYRTR